VLSFKRSFVMAAFREVLCVRGTFIDLRVQSSRHRTSTSLPRLATLSSSDDGSEFAYHDWLCKGGSVVSPTTSKQARFPRAHGSDSALSVLCGDTDDASSRASTHSRSPHAHQSDSVLSASSTPVGHECGALSDEPSTMSSTEVCSPEGTFRRSDSSLSASTTSTLPECASTTSTLPECTPWPFYAPVPALPLFELVCVETQQLLLLQQQQQQQQDLRFRFHVRQVRHGDGLGATTWQSPCSSCFTVSEIAPGGALAAWNKQVANKDSNMAWKEVMPGDIIECINGVSSFDGMRQEFVKKFLLDVHVRRPCNPTQTMYTASALSWQCQL